MASYRTCRPCKRMNNCDLKNRLSKALNGFNVTMIAHKCPEFEGEFQRGDNLMVRFNMGYEDGEAYLAEFPAVFIQFSETMAKAVVYVEPGAQSDCGNYEFEPLKNGRGFCKVSYTPIRSKWSIGTEYGIYARREGRTQLRECCDLPLGDACEECRQWKAA